MKKEALKAIFDTTGINFLSGLHVKILERSPAQKKFFRALIKWDESAGVQLSNESDNAARFAKAADSVRVKLAAINPLMDWRLKQTRYYRWCQVTGRDPYTGQLKDNKLEQEPK
jgi:hypothetical protein